MISNMGTCAVVGGQFGSEGKGLVVSHIAHQYDHHVRVGAANAGHTLWTDTQIDPLNPGGMLHGMEKHVMQQIPCAAYANPDATLYVGPGALISPEIFDRELERLFRWRRDRRMSDPRIVVDPRAHVITDEQIEMERRSDLAERIGSTSTIAKEGIGYAQAARVMRGGLVTCDTAQAFYGDEEPEDVEHPLYLGDVPMSLARATGGVLLEGTQGTGLSLTTGDFPYVTSRNTTAAGLAADCGVAPNILDRVILVCRTFPIRVAGNSGPFHRGSSEISWRDIGINPENERTTVTKKIRRVATFSLEQVYEAALINGATEIALTFADYLAPELAGSRGTLQDDGHAELSGYTALWDLITAIETSIGLHVRFVGTGPHHVIERKLASTPVNPIALAAA